MSWSQNYFLLAAFILFIGMVIWEFFSTKKRVAFSIRTQSYQTNLINLVFNNLILLIISIHFFYSLAEYHSWQLLPLFAKWSNVSMTSVPGLLFQFILLDFLIYIWHILNHKINFLWNFHKIHHSDSDLNTSTGIRFHIGELLLSLIYKGIIIIVLGVSIKVILIFEFITIYAATFHHSNIRFTGEFFLSYFFVMPSHHATHHSVSRLHHNSNYGVVFSIWDYIFGTKDFYQPRNFGLPDTSDMNFKDLLRYSFSGFYPWIISILLLILLIIQWQR